MEMSARYSPNQRFAATKFVLGCTVPAASAQAARELAAAVAAVHNLPRCDVFKVGNFQSAQGGRWQLINVLAPQRNWPSNIECWQRVKRKAPRWKRSRNKSGRR